MTNVFHYCIIVLPMVFSFSIVGVITDIILTKSVPESDTGNTYAGSQFYVLTEAVGCFACFWLLALAKLWSSLPRSFFDANQIFELCRKNAKSQSLCTSHVICFRTKGNLHWACLFARPMNAG